MSSVPTPKYPDPEELQAEISRVTPHFPAPSLNHVRTQVGISFSFDDFDIENFQNYVKLKGNIKSSAFQLFDVSFTS